jgi:Zn-dependent protease with chaperone function
MQNLLQRIKSAFSWTKSLTALTVIFVMVFGILCTMGNSVMLASASTPMSEMTADQMSMADGDAMNMDHCNQSDGCEVGLMQHSILGNLTVTSALFIFAVATALLLVSRFSRLFNLPKVLSFNFLFKKFLVLKNPIPKLRISLFKIFDPIMVAFSRGLIHPQLYN